MEAGYQLHLHSFSIVAIVTFFSFRLLFLCHQIINFSRYLRWCLISVLVAAQLHLNWIAPLHPLLKYSFSLILISSLSDCYNLLAGHLSWRLLDSWRNKLICVGVTGQGHARVQEISGARAAFQGLPRPPFSVSYFLDRLRLIFPYPLLSYFPLLSFHISLLVSFHISSILRLIFPWIVFIRCASPASPAPDATPSLSWDTMQDKSNPTTPLSFEFRRTEGKFSDQRVAGLNSS